MIRPIIHDQAALQVVSTPASPLDWPIADDLLDTLAAHRDNCVGLAANMIGHPKRIIAVTLGPANVAMLNPKLTKKSGPYQVSEGCLSLPGERQTTRYRNITVAYDGKDGKRQSLQLTGLAAQIVQHELDHCDGILI